MVQTITEWSKVPTRQPFEAEEYNRFIKWVRGELAAPARWVARDGTVLIDLTLLGPLVSSESEHKIMLKGNATPTTIRAALHAGAKAGSRATTDAVILLANDESGTDYQFLYGLLFGGSNQAVSGTLGTLIGTGGLSALNGIDLSGATFATAGKILHLPGIVGRAGLYVSPVNSTTGLRIVADLSNNTLKSRLLFQPGDAESTSIPGLGVIPTAAGAKAGLFVFSDDDPDNSHWGALVANATDGLIELMSDNSGTGTARPIAIGTDAVRRLRIPAALYQLVIGREADGPSDIGLYVSKVGGSAAARDILLDEESGIQIREGNGSGAGTARRVVYHDESGGNNALYIGVDTWAYLIHQALTAHDLEVGGASALLVDVSGARLPNTRWLRGRNAGASADINLIRATSGDVIETGQTGTTHTLLGTVVAPTIDPPTVQGQVTARSQCQGWATITYSAGVPTLEDSYNVTSITDDGTGILTITWDRDFANTNYCILLGYRRTGAGALCFQRVVDQQVGTCQIETYTSGGAAVDPLAIYVTAFGTLS